MLLLVQTNETSRWRYHYSLLTIHLSSVVQRSKVFFIQFAMCPAQEAIVHWAANVTSALTRSKIEIVGHRAVSPPCVSLSPSCKVCTSEDRVGGIDSGSLWCLAVSFHERAWLFWVNGCTKQTHFPLLIILWSGLLWLSVHRALKGTAFGLCQ